MFEKVNHIELSGETFPIWCGMEVLEQIQEEYGDLAEFEKKLQHFVPELDDKGNPKKNKAGMFIGSYEMPNIKVLNNALFWMVSAGLDIEGKEPIDKKTLIRMVDMSPLELGGKLHDEFSRCFTRKNA